MTILTRSAYALPGTSTGFKTGTWRVQRPVHRHLAAPCHVACPAGEDAQGRTPAQIVWGTRDANT